MMDVLDEDRQAKWHAQASGAGMLRPPTAADDCGTQHGRATLGHATRRATLGHATRRSAALASALGERRAELTTERRWAVR
ncbi:MAG: hypothetical protein V2A79_04385 [Planctomycetota bacterium]